MIDNETSLDCAIELQCNEEREKCCTMKWKIKFSKELQGSLLVLFSAFTFSIMTLFVEAAGKKGIPSFEMMIVRCVFQIILSSVVCSFIGVNPFGHKGNRMLPVLRGFVGPLATGALFYGATKIAIADATVLKFTSPIWTILIARIFLKESITLTKAIGVFIGFIGVVFVAQPEFLIDLIFRSDVNEYQYQTVDENSSEIEPGSLQYALVVLVCLFGAMCSASVYVIIKKSGDSVHFQVLVFYYGVIGALTSIILLFLLEGYPVMPPDWETWGYLALIAVCGYVAQSAFNKGGQLISATKTACFRSTDVAFVLLWQITLLHEMPTVWSVVGIFFVCLCTIVVSLSKDKKEDTFKPLPNEIEMEEVLMYENPSSKCDLVEDVPAAVPGFTELFSQSFPELAFQQQVK